MWSPSLFGETATMPAPRNQTPNPNPNATATPASPQDAAMGLALVRRRQLDQQQKSVRDAVPRPHYPPRSRPPG